MVMCECGHPQAAHFAQYVYCTAYACPCLNFRLERQEVEMNVNLPKTFPMNFPVMTSDRFNELVAEARHRQDGLLEKKGADYTRHDPDRLSNFKRLAKDLDLPPTKVWAVYAGKHWDAVMAFIKTGKAESEAIEGRLDDLHNYLYLLEGLLKEAE